uniref:Uncharacterized protein n=1 Tax=Globodera rostochiensis TaxID=31243 RepID=A0A914HY99_GLORO
MFFSYNILVSKNSNFAVIWKYMHDRRGALKVSKRELVSIDIEKACEDLVNYIPTGELVKSELRNKMSLYLLAQLSYGITLVLNAQADYLIADLQSAIKSLIRVPVEEKHEKTPRKSAGRKRKITELDGMVELAIAVPRGMEAEEIEEEDAEEIKRRRVSAARKSTLLNLSDPRAYVDQQLPARVGPDDSLLLDEGSRLDDMFLGQSVQPALPPPEWAAEKNALPPLGEPAAEERRESQKVSTFSILAGPGDDTLIREVEQTVTVTTSFSVSHPSAEVIGDNGLELPVGAREPIYKKSTEEFIVDVMRDSIDRLQLDALPDIVQSPRAVTRKRKRLLVDDQLMLTNDEMVERMNNYQDLVRNRDDLLKEICLPEVPTLSQLLSPRPYHIKALSSELYPLFDTVRADYRDRPLTFEEAQAMTFEDFQKRRFDVDVRSWNSNGASTPLLQRVEESFGAAVEQERHETREKVSVTGALMPPVKEEIIDDSSMQRRPSSALEGEAMRRDTDDRRLTGHLPERHVDELILADLDHLQPPLGEITADMELLQESVTTKGRSPTMWDERSVDDNTSELYSRIARVGVMSFDELLKSDSFDETKKSAVTRATAARKFFALLNLLKHRMVKARQRKPYGEILIRARVQLEDGAEQSFADQE